LMARPQPLILEPEARLLLACLDHRADAVQTVKQLLRQPIDWPTLIEYAARHRVRPALWAALCQLSKGVAPPAVEADLGRFVQLNSKRSLWLISELLRLLDAFATSGIRAVPFKGPMLGMLAYGSPSLREAGDLDLLVPRADMGRAHDLLISLGHRPTFPTATASEAAYLQSLCAARRAAYLHAHSEHHLVRDDGLNIDLHWALAVADFHLRLDEQELWSGLATMEFFGRSLQTFGREELLLVLCINGAKDCWERIDRITDIAGLLRRCGDLDWDRIERRARSIGATRILCLGLSLAATLLSIQLDEAAQRLIDNDAAVANLSSRVIAALFRPVRTSAETASFRRSLLHLRMRERFRDRAGYILEHLRPGVGDWAALPLPAALSPIHYLTRPPRLLARYFLRAK
jgi:hypothetical protein